MAKTPIFRWQEPKRGLFSDYPVRQVALFMVIGCIVGAVGGSAYLWDDKPVSTTSYLIAGTVGVCVFLGVILFAWFADAVSSRREVGNVALDEEGIHIQRGTESTRRRWRDLENYEIKESRLGPRLRVDVLYLYRIGTAAAFERHEAEGNELHEESAPWQGITEVMLSPGVDRDELRSFLDGRINEG